MARIKLAPNVTQNLTSPLVDDIGLGVSYLFRAKIIHDRHFRGFEKADISGPPNAFETSGLSIFETEKLAREKKMRENRNSGRRYIDGGTDMYTNEPINNIFEGEYGKFKKDTISIVDFDFEGKHENTRGYSSITLPFIPRELSYEPTSKFVGIATMGRNNPHYHFTGSEDSLQFEIDWYYVDDESRKEVINSCRWIEALTKGDGYSELPHRVKLVWGQDDVLFRDSVWVIVEAPYILRNFLDGYRRDKDSEIKRGNLLPQHATQKITLKRVTQHNLTSAEIIKRI